MRRVAGGLARRWRLLSACEECEACEGTVSGEPGPNPLQYWFRGTFYTKAKQSAGEA